MKTLDYYESNAKEYFKKTVNVNFAETRAAFLDNLEDGAYILDFGCGSGRDAKAFKDAGYRVDALDGSAELCRLASDYAKMEVKHMRFTDFHEKETYDGIWACASLLHLPYDALKEVVGRLCAGLKENGILYASFKYGNFEGVREGRYYTDFNEEKTERLLHEVPGLQLEKQWVSMDALPGRDGVRWLNFLGRKR